MGNYYYWTNLARNHDKVNWVVCNWTHYIVGGENEKWKGLCGRKYKIVYLNGKEVFTTNLWYQGEIPENERFQFRNNVSKVELAEKW